MKNARPQISEASALDTRNSTAYEPKVRRNPPAYPPHDTQAARLLALALAGEKINPLYGWRKLGIYRLSDTKFRLKEMGWPFEADRLDVSNRFGEPCHVALYGLPESAINEAGDAGQAFARHEIELMSRRAG